MLRALAFLLCASPALACDRPVCLATPGAVSLNRVVTFDDMPSGYGTGTRLDTLLLADGVGFGERFAGQDLGETADHDTLAGAVLSPLTLLPGEPGGNLGIMRLMGTNILLGHGPRLHPADNAVGEGAIAVLFDTDQAALGFDLRGGEDGLAEITFFNRQGTVIDRIRLGPVAEDVFLFHRAGMQADIAGFTIVNTDPQGIALDNLRYADLPPLG